MLNNNIGSKPICNPKLIPFFILLLFVLVFGGLMLLDSQAKAQEVKPADKVLKDTVISANTYKLYVGAKGGKYVLRTSGKTGKVYKQYIKK